MSSKLIQTKKSQLIYPFDDLHHRVATVALYGTNNPLVVVGNLVLRTYYTDDTKKNVDHTVEIITASVRTPNHVTQAALLGADIATVPFGALKKCLKHPLTDAGLKSFEADWEKVKAQQ